LLALPVEGSAGVLGCPSGAGAPIVGWQGTAGVERRRLAAERSAEAEVPRDRWSPGRAEREAEAQDACARGMDDDRSQPREGPRRIWVQRVKPETPRRERSPSPAPSETAPHPAEAGLWERFLSRGNLAEALRRVEQNAGAPGIDGMSTKELRPWLKDHWPEVRSQLEAGTYRPQPVRRVTIPKPSGGVRVLGVPAAVDRLICQALSQVLTPVFEPHFHPPSSAFGWGARPIRRSSGHAASSLMARCGASILIWTRSSIKFSTTP
jgi:hypothetical protein